MNKTKIILIVTISIIILFIILTTIHINSYNYITKDIEILQVGKVDKTKLEDMTRTNNPIIITEFYEKPEFNPININDLKIKVSN